MTETKNLEKIVQCLKCGKIGKVKEFRVEVVDPYENKAYFCKIECFLEYRPQIFQGGKLIGKEYGRKI